GIGPWRCRLLPLLLPFVHRHCEERSDDAIQSLSTNLDCFASLAMTTTSSRRQLVIDGIVGIAGDIAAIEGRAIIGGERKAVLQPSRQIRVGNEDATERDRIRMSLSDRSFRGLAGEAASRDQHAFPDRT